MSNNFIQWFHSIGPKRLIRSGLVTVAAVISFGALVLPIAIRPSSYPLQVGAVADSDITAPFSATYESAVLTQKAKEDAASSVSTLYLPSDPTITRTQIDDLHIVLNYLDTVRADAFGTEDQKISDINDLKSVTISPDSASLILQLSDSDWENVKTESLTILEQILRKSIRDYQIEDNKTSIPNMIDLSFSDSEVKLIQELVDPFIVANSLYSAKDTEIAKNAAIAAVKTVKVTYIQGQAIVLRGQVITDEQFEALQYYGFVKPQSKLTEIIPPFLIVLLLTGLLVLYFDRRRFPAILDLHSLTFIVITYIVFLLAARAIIPNRAILPYLFPLPAFAFVLAALFNLEVSVIFTLAISILASFGLSNANELAVFYLFSSLIGALFLGRGRRVSSFFWAGIWSAITGILVIATYRVLDSSIDLVGMVTLVGVTILNGIACASLALLFQFIASQSLGLTTPLSLMEISRPDHPLLQFILQNAPGTYQHSLQVSNLAEQGAKAIGADQLLIRVGALYHDCGKTINASFFIENQIPGKINSHDDMDPSAAAQIIIDHVKNGIALAEKHHLPPRIKDFIREHHGTALTRYQYGRALDLAHGDRSRIDERLYHYPGPKPRSKETAILMLADGCEARARAKLPKTDEELHQLIQKVVDNCIQEGQLEDSILTLKDIKSISEAFFQTMVNTHHPRLKYPESQTEIVKNKGGNIL